MIAVLGAGRSGTNMCLEILRGHSLLIPGDPGEDKRLFEHFYFPYHPQYVCKCDTHYLRSYKEEFVRLFNCCAHLRIIWMIRDPRDMCISRIYRGYDREADDATFAGCVQDMYKMWDVAQRAFKDYPNKIYLQKMEDILLYPEKSVKSMCDFLTLEFEEDMLKFYERMRNPEYTYTEIDKTRVGLYKNWKTIYDGFFTRPEFDIDMEKVFELMQPLIEYFGYE